MLDKLLSLRKKLDISNRSELFKRSAHNTMWSTLDYLVLPILFIVATPIFVGHLGVEMYGLWMLSNTLTGFTGLFAFGLTDATIKFVSKYHALDDTDGVVRVAQSTLLMYGSLGLFALAATFFAAPFLVEKVFNIKPQDFSLAITVLRLSGLGIAVRFIDSVFMSVFQGYQRYDLSAKVTIPANILTVVSNVVLVLMGFHVKEVVTCSIAVLALSALSKSFLLRRILSLKINLIPRFDVRTIKEIWSYGMYSWVQDMSAILLGQVDRLLIASLLSTSALAYYSVCLQLAQQIHAVLSKGTAFLFPLSSASLESGNKEGMRRIYFKALRLVTVVAVGIGFPLFLFADKVLTVWMGPAFAEHATIILRILAFGFTVLATSIVPYYYMNGIGFVRLNTVFGFISGTAVAGSVVLLIPSLGLPGVALAWLANIPVGLISRTIMHRRVFGDMRWYTSLLILGPIIVTFLLGLPLLDWLSSQKIGIILLGGAMCFSGIVASLASFLFSKIIPIETVQS